MVYSVEDIFADDANFGFATSTTSTFFQISTHQRNNLTAMIYQRGGLVIQRHNEIRDLQAELLDMVCYDMQVEQALQPITGEGLARGTNQALDARLDVHCRGFDRGLHFSI